MSFNDGCFNVTNSAVTTNYLHSNVSMTNTSITSIFGSNEMQEVIMLGGYYLIENFGEMFLDKVLEQTVSLSKWSFSLVKNSFSKAGAYIDKLFSRAVSFPSAEAAEVLPVPCDSKPSNEQLEELQREILKNQKEEILLQKQTLEMLKQNNLKVEQEEEVSHIHNIDQRLDLLSQEITKLYYSIVKDSRRLRQIEPKLSNSGGKTVENPAYVELYNSIEDDKSTFCLLCQKRKNLIEKINYKPEPFPFNWFRYLSFVPDKKVSEDCKEFSFLKDFIEQEKCC